MSKAALGGGDVGYFNSQFWPSSKWEFFLFKAVSVQIPGPGSVSTKQINNNHPTDSWLHLTHWIYLRKLLLLANTDSMPACQLWDKYLVWRRERPIVLRVFQKIIHLKEVTFHYAWTIPVLLKKSARKKRKKRSCNFLNCKKIFFLSLFLTFFPPGLAAVFSVLQELRAGKCRGRFQFQVKLYRTRIFPSPGTVWGLFWTRVVVKVSWGREDEG